MTLYFRLFWSIAFFMRTGVLFKCIRNGIRPMIGGVLISYRKGLPLFEKITLSLQVRAWGESEKKA